MKGSFFFNVINNYFSHRKDIKQMTRLTIVGLKVTINSQRNLTASSTCTILNIDKSSPNFLRVYCIRNRSSYLQVLHVPILKVCKTLDCQIKM